MAHHALFPLKAVLLQMTMVCIMLLSLQPPAEAWQSTTPGHRPVPPSKAEDRRTFLLGISATAMVAVGANASPAAAAAPDLRFATSTSGIQWADAKVGSGTAKRVGDVAAVDYVLSTTGARYGSRIYSTQADPNAPTSADLTPLREDLIRDLDRLLLLLSFFGRPTDDPAGIACR